MMKLPHHFLTLWLTASLLSVWGCSPRVTMTAERNDTTITTIENRARDTLISIEVPPERIVTVTRLDTVFVASTALAEVRITPQDGEYKIDLHHREHARVEKVIQIPEQRVTTEHHQVLTKTEIKEVNVLKWWQEGLIYIGLFALMFVIVNVIAAEVKLHRKI